MREWHCTIPIVPVAKARARSAVTKSGKTVHYTPNKTAHTENIIRDYASKSDVYFEKGVPLKLTLLFMFERPKSAPKKRKYPVVKPDDDNCEKLVRDALNSVLYHDDAQIVSKQVDKVYAMRWGIFISVEEIA